MEEKKFRDLLDRYSRKECSKAEEALLESWYIQEGRKRSAGRQTYDDVTSIEQEIWHQLSERAGWDQRARMKPRTKLWQWSVAASLILVLGMGYYFYSGQFPQKGTTVLVKRNDVLPGSNKATLYLSDGTAVELDDSGREQLLARAGLTISKLENGQLVYEVSKTEESTNEGDGFHSIKTPRGGQYQVVLADGTRVWLNAASSLRYPVVFAGDRREVELTGEAYFDVEKDPSRRFIVHAADQKVSVLGTVFNVSAYNDGSSIRTTLIEGSVALSLAKDDQHTAVVLRPGQQAKFRDNKFAVSRVDVEEAIAWKNGYFVFEKEKLATALQKISRWYDVQVVYEGRLPSVEIGGSVSKFDDVEKVLEVLRLTTGMSFNLEGRRLIVGK